MKTWKWLALCVVSGALLFGCGSTMQAKYDRDAWIELRRFCAGDGCHLDVLPDGTVSAIRQSDYSRLHGAPDSLPAPIPQLPLMRF